MNNTNKLTAANPLTVNVENLKFSFYFSDGTSSSKNLVDMLHTHSYYELFATITPPVTVLFKERMAKLQSGDLLLIPPNFHHTRLLSEVISQNCISIGICVEKKDTDYSFDLWKRYKHIFNTSVPVRFSGCEALNNTLFDIIVEAQNDASIDIALKIVGCIDDISKREANPLPLLSSSDPSKNDTTDIVRLIQFESIIKSKFSIAISTDEIAQQLYISRRHLDRITKQHYGKTAHDLLRQKQVEYAANLLLGSDLTLAEVAQQSGFGNPRNFTRNFVKFYGCTPSQYRTDNSKT